MLISRKKDKDLNGPTVMHGSELTSEQRLNLLGVSFSSSGTITEHVLAKAKTAGKLVSMLRRNRMFLSERARFQVYVSCIRPILEYASPLFLNSPGYALKALDRIDLRAKRLFPSVGTDSLALRRDVAGLCLLYSIVHGNAPTLVLDSIKPIPLPVARSTRFNEATNLASLKIPRSKTKHHENSFLPYYSRIWNPLSTTTVFSTNLQQFKVQACGELRTRANSLNAQL